MGSFGMALTVMEKVGACLFMVKCSYLEGKKKYNLFSCCMCFVSVFKQEAVVL